MPAPIVPLTKLRRDSMDALPDIRRHSAMTSGCTLSRGVETATTTPPGPVAAHAPRAATANTIA
jgi:hypothetical protein